MNFRRTKIKKEKFWRGETILKHVSMTNGWLAEEHHLDDIEREIRGDPPSYKTRDYVSFRFFRDLK